MDVATIGYRLLVYLKYSFQGLAFPPGHGYLPLFRLPSVREELLNFLLEDSKESILQVPNSLKLSYKNFPNLCHILCLDTEATLDVLKCAFKDMEPIDDQSVNDQAVVLLSRENHHELENSQTQQTLVQRTTDVLISILDLESDLVNPSEIFDNTDTWPSERDINLLLEFIAYLVANKRAQVSATVLKHILKYLTSSKLAPEYLENKASQKEKQVLSVLKAVSQEIWNFSYVLPLCMEANFYQACGFIHYISGEYVSALDSYMKDIDEPVHAFSFVNEMLLQLKGTEALTFQSAVIQRIPELVKLSRECTFVLVIDQLGGECQNILSQLHSHPQSLFLFLKTVIDVHVSGTLNFSVPEADFNTHNLRLNDTCNELKDYFKKISNLPKILHNDMIQVTDELTELYLELLCQYESNSVLKFLETFDNYRLDNCLKICQEYGVKDAAAFLLERVGDVGSALVLLMSGIDEKIELLVTTVQNKFDEMTSRKLSDIEWLAKILELKEAYAVRDVLHASIGLCQRNTQRLDRQESDSLWFHLFDSMQPNL
ncbi:hypothetical protein HPP92_014635 [Vanilla planifolia]|uniref:Vacuolar protein sorting-associated protein 8 central domain-containing protein n=1 Tax=Vanilla planifolia TaxID=51239 RepID=A0A835USX2_VANPL|nr:hypothetical protein HPP92_014635 [Vanilla planifolia]